jgi:hypothetical protein
LIKLTLGSIFDKKCDVLIVPCNATGGVTSWVFSELKLNGLPQPSTDVAFGSVVFDETKLTNTENAEVVALLHRLRVRLTVLRHPQYLA